MRQVRIRKTAKPRPQDEPDTRTPSGRPLPY
jgi:hypothetical protein